MTDLVVATGTEVCPQRPFVPRLRSPDAGMPAVSLITWMKWVGYDQNCLTAAVPIVPRSPDDPHGREPFFPIPGPVASGICLTPVQLILQRKTTDQIPSTQGKFPTVAFCVLFRGVDRAPPDHPPLRPRMPRLSQGQGIPVCEALTLVAGACRQ